MQKLVIAALALLLAACTGTTTQRIAVSDAASEAEAKTQKVIALRAILDDEARLDRIAYPILTGAHSMCGDKVAYTYGLKLSNRFDYGKDFREAAATVLGLDEHIRVRALIAGGAARKVGLHVGDRIIAINGQELPAGEDGIKKLRDSEFIKTINEAPELNVTVERAEGRSTLRLQGEKACNYAVRFVLGDAVNAFADGKSIVVFRGLMRMARNDNELALVIGHELAHNAMGHIDKKKQNAGLGSFFDLLAAARGVNTQGMFGKMTAGAFSQDFEAEADYVGLYMLATTGIDIADAPQFWRRMAAENPGSINSNHAASHPATSYRFLALEKTVQEIAEKKRKNQPLVPEKKTPAEGQVSQ